MNNKGFAVILVLFVVMASMFTTIMAMLILYNVEKEHDEMFMRIDALEVAEVELAEPAVATSTIATSTKEEIYGEIE